jgi:hypothetical protein
VTPRTLLVSALVLAACGVAFTQSQPPPRPTVTPDPAPQAIPPTAVPVAPQAIPQPPRVAVPDVPLSEKSLDQLLDRLEALRGQKAELEKLEQEVLKEVRRKLEKQSDRINRLGIMPSDPLVAPAVPSISNSPAPIPNQLPPPPPGAPAVPRND